MSTEMKSNSCRICLTTNVGGVKLDKNSDMLKILEFCVDFAVDLTFAPKIICEKCVEEVDKFAKFKRKCIESEELWKSVNKYNNEIECNITNAMKETKHCEGNYNEEIYNELVADGINQSKVKGSISVIVPTIVKDFKSYSRNNTKDNEKYSSVDKKKYFCTKCNKEYSSNKWLVTHKRNVCYKDKYKDDMLENVKRDDDESTQNCGLCQTSLTDIKSHLDEHWHNNDLLCKICNYTGRDFADMITHRHIHCKKTKLYCHACNKKKASILSLQFHFRSVHLHKTGGLCSICSKTFAKFKTWKKHVRLHNEENSLFICDICGKKFLYRHEIKSHLIDHSNVRQFVCEICGKDFKRMSALKEHIANMHFPNAPVECSHCKRTYKSHIKLNLHLKKIVKDKLFVCEVCSKRFLTENILKKHMFWHTGERPYTCEVCGSKYKAKGQLNLHMRIHTGFMPHKCLDCGKGFPTGKQLKRHKSVHTGIRAHKCEHCERSFHEKKALTEHSLLHKDIENVKLET